MLLSAEAKFVSKKRVRIMVNLIYISRNSSHKHIRVIASSEDECLNFHRICHFGQDYRFLNYHTKKKNSNSCSNNRQKRENRSPKS